MLEEQLEAIEGESGKFKELAERSEEAKTAAEKLLDKQKASYSSEKKELRTILKKKFETTKEYEKVKRRAIILLSDPRAIGEAREKVKKRIKDKHKTAWQTFLKGSEYEKLNNMLINAYEGKIVKLTNKTERESQRFESANTLLELFKEKGAVVKRKITKRNKDYQNSSIFRRAFKHKTGRFRKGVLAASIISFLTLSTGSLTYTYTKLSHRYLTKTYNHLITERESLVEKLSKSMKTLKKSERDIFRNSFKNSWETFPHKHEYIVKFSLEKEIPSRAAISFLMGLYETRGYDLTTISHAGAASSGQFMMQTAKMLGLHIDPEWQKVYSANIKKELKGLNKWAWRSHIEGKRVLKNAILDYGNLMEKKGIVYEASRANEWLPVVDERFDHKKAGIAMERHFAWYTKKDWRILVAAYNWGGGYVKELEDTHGKGYDKIKKHLPKVTLDFIEYIERNHKPLAKNYDILKKIIQNSEQLREHPYVQKQEIIKVDSA